MSVYVGMTTAELIAEVTQDPVAGEREIVLVDRLQACITELEVLEATLSSVGAAP